MPNTIVLKDKDANNVTFQLVGTSGETAIFRAQGATLLGAPEVTLRIQRKQNVNRVYAKLSIPTVCTDDPCGKQAVSYTEVGSLDLSSVLSASEAARDNFVALFASLAANHAVQAMYTDGMSPLV